jgi:hypothetical protein
MSAGNESPRSIAAELALLFLRELEPQLEKDPERLVSTEAILSFATVRRSDPLTWQHWRRILERFGKSELIDYMLNEPLSADHDESRSAADRLIALVLETGIEFFHDPDQNGWASIRVDGHWENHRIRSRPFQLFLLRTYYRETSNSPGAQAVRAALELFEAKALFDGDETAVNLRVANHRDKLYLDLCDRAWRAVEIDTEGWRIVDRPPARFHRTRGSQPVPVPQHGGALDELRHFLNVDHQGWTLIRAFLVAVFRPGISYPILVAKGEQGAGKSTACRVISSLVDPRTAALRGVPREVRDLTAAARNSWLVCFDNLSHLPDELADAACRLATGGGFGGRELYTNHDEAVFDATRPLVFNAIPDLGTARPDFLDRALVVDFLDIKPEMRCDEGRFWREFEEARPRILGALLDAASAGLGNLSAVMLDQLPRMADFAIWASACESALGLEKGEALEAYRANCAESRNLALEESPIYEPLREVARAGFSGTSSELLSLLCKVANDATRRSRRWPKAPNALSNALRRITGNLRSSGIEIYFNRADHQGTRVISVKLASLAPERSSASSATAECS